MFLLASNCIPVVVNHLLMAFYGFTVPHNCRVIILIYIYFLKNKAKSTCVF